ncbi:hypothetical protein [Streptomyces sp. NPDC058773]|uniref:hypothetical protein n=1 Tax=Streptomyces sp. NPDC058773 TaxID=3346632 RepID=UPI0036CAB0A3
MPDDSSAAPASAVGRLASWLRRRDRPGPAPDTPPDRSADQPPPPSRLRPQPEDDASVYPLF